MSIRSADYAFVCDLVRDGSANVLGEGKEYLVESRLHGVAYELGFPSVEDLIQRLRATREPALRQRVIEAMTTNETLFFRDVGPFEALRKQVLPEVLARKPGQRVNIWCAACSTGQEPYSVAMTLSEMSAELVSSQRTYLMATDIATSVLARARNGLYSQIEVNRGLPASMLVRYFTARGTEWQIRDDLRRLVDFRELNLVGDWPLMPKMDIIFLRNVLIYFDAETKRQILSRLPSVMAPGGVLFLGSTETMFNMEAFERVEVGRTSYQRLRG